MVLTGPGQFTLYAVAAAYYACLAVVLGTFFFQGWRSFMDWGRKVRLNLLYLVPALAALAILIYVVMPVEGSRAVLPPDEALYGRVLDVALVGLVLGAFFAFVRRRLSHA